MQKMLIQLDVKKIEIENIYDIEDMLKTIDEVFAEGQCIKEISEDGVLIYSGNPNRGNYLADFGIAYITLKESRWFVEYSKKWTWLINDDDENGPFKEIDCLTKAKKYYGIV